MLARQPIYVASFASSADLRLSRRVSTAERLADAWLSLAVGAARLARLRVSVTLKLLFR